MSPLTIPSTAALLYAPLLHLRALELSALASLSSFLASHPMTVPLLLPATTFSQSCLRSLEMLHRAGVAIAVMRSPEPHATVKERAVLKQYLLRVQAIHPSTERMWRVDAATTRADIARCAAEARGLRCWFLHAAPASMTVLAAMAASEDLASALHVVPCSASGVPGGLASYARLPAQQLIALGDGVPACTGDVPCPPETRLPPVHRLACMSGWAGFADYTILPSRQTISGASSPAGILHATFSRPRLSCPCQEDIWITHAQVPDPSALADATDNLKRQGLSPVLRALQQTSGGQALLKYATRNAAAITRYAIAHHLEWIATRYS